MSKALRYLPILLAASLLLSSCAGVSQPQKDKRAPVIQDLSNPNLASMYYFMSGSFLHFSGDLSSADQLLNLALSQDPGSFQIRKLLFINQMQIYNYIQSEEAEQATRSMLAMASASYDFDQEMLTHAYNAYRKMDDAEGVDWALERLLADYPKAQVYIWEYIRQLEAGNKAPVALLEKALKAESDIPEIEFIVASLYLDINPKRARQILLNSSRGKASELQLLELYRQQNEEDEILAHFDTYSYPEDKDKIQDYLMFLMNYSLHNIALEHTDEILQTGDVELIEVLSYHAFWENDLSALRKVHQYLLSKISAPQEDSPTAALLLLEYIVDPEFTEGLEMTGKIYQIKDLVYLSYLFASQYTYHEKREGEYQKVFGELHQLIQDNLPPSLIKDFLVDHTAYLAGIDDNDSSSAVALAEDLIGKGYGEEEDFQLLFQHYSDIGDDARQIAIMRESLLRYPGSATIKNNLGYILLDYPQHLDEAEQLISEALQDDPQNLSFLDSWAWLLYKRGRYQAAYDFLPQVLEDAELNAELLYHAAMISGAAGAQEEAIQFFEQILETQPFTIYHEQALSELKRLGEINE